MMVIDIGSNDSDTVVAGTGNDDVTVDPSVSGGIIDLMGYNPSKHLSFSNGGYELGFATGSTYAINFPLIMPDLTLRLDGGTLTINNSVATISQINVTSGNVVLDHSTLNVRDGGNPGNLVLTNGSTFHFGSGPNYLQKVILGGWAYDGVGATFIYDPNIVTAVNTVPGFQISMDGVNWVAPVAWGMEGGDGDVFCQYSVNQADYLNAPQLYWRVLGAFGVVFDNGARAAAQSGAMIPDGEGGWISICQLDAPTNLEVQEDYTEPVVLQWDAVTDAQGYAIYRSDDNGYTFQVVGTTADTTFQDEPTWDSGTYQYRVTAIAGGESQPSNLLVVHAVYAG